MKLLSVLFLALLSITCPVAHAIQTTDGNTVIVHEDSLGNFQRRLELIETAAKSIKIETYILVPDAAGRLLLQALVAKARQGINVQIILDSSLKRGLSPAQAQVLRKYGVDVRYFNPPFSKFTQNLGHRTHRKLMIIDDNWVMAGGRNLVARYFEIDNEQAFNFVDRDLEVTGPVVQDTVAAFDEFWNSQKVQKVLPKKDAENDNAFQALLRPHQGDIDLRQQIAKESLSQLQAARTFENVRMGFISDGPTPGKEDRRVTPFIHEKFLSAQKELLIENWIFIPSPEKRKIFATLMNRGVDVKVLTNSFASMNDTRTIEVAVPFEKKAAQEGVQIHTLTGKIPLGEHAFGTNIKKWGTHAKDFVVDGRDTFIGTYNLDPRSQNYNCEDGFWIENNPEFASFIASRINERMQTSKRIGPDGKYFDGVAVDADGPQGWKAKLKDKILHKLYWLF